MNKLKFKKLNYAAKDKEGNPTVMESQAVLPKKAHATDAGYDLTATRITQEVDEAGKLILVYHTDLTVEIPEGYVGLLFMRSSVCKKSIQLCNCTGVIDSNYRGEIMGKFKVTTDALPRIYEPGEKFAQLVLVPYYTVVETEWVEELTETERGEGGFGSTDTKAA